MTSISAGIPMIDSINGTFVNADLCLAVNNQLLLRSIFNVSGRGPFRTLLFGLIQSEAQLVKTFINQNPPYDLSVEIKNTELWKTIDIDRFYIQIIDQNGNAGNVTIYPSHDEEWVLARFKL